MSTSKAVIEYPSDILVAKALTLGMLYVILDQIKIRMYYFIELTLLSSTISSIHFFNKFIAEKRSATSVVPDIDFRIRSL